MITQLLRRLQGHGERTGSSKPARRDVAASDTACVEGETLPTPLLRSAFVRHLLDTPPGTPMVAGLAADIADRLDAQCERLDVARLPRLPSVLLQLLVALRDGSSHSDALAAVLARDATLAGEVMRAGGAGAFGDTESVTGLQQAINALGNEGLRYAVLVAAMRPILHADPSQQGQSAGNCLAAHAEARTWLCASLATPADAGDAQFASVVASTGLAALLRMMPRSLLTQAAADPAFAPRLLELAAELSGRAAAHWRLGEGLQTLLHGLPRGSNPGTRDDVLHRADLLAMLHVLRCAGLAGEDAHVTDSDAERVRDARLLSALREMDADRLAA